MNRVSSIAASFARCTTVRRPRATGAPWLAAALVAIASTAAVLVAAGEILTVQVQSTRLRRDARAWAPSVATLEEGARVEQITRQGDWIQVSAGGSVGWVHASAVTERELTLSAPGGSVPVEASASEVSLAGKGFDEQVEAEYRATNPALDFAAVDRLENLSVGPDELEGFLREGKLADWGTP